MRVFISGPITKGDRDNEAKRELARIRFFQEEQRLYDAGFDDVVNPFRVVPNPKPWRECMQDNITALMTCDSIYMLPEWEESEGSSLEYEIAMRLSYTLITLP